MTRRVPTAVKKQIPFTTIPKADVPHRLAKAKPVNEATGSQWESALGVLSDPSIAIKVVERNQRLRNQKKATLQTIAKNRGLRIAVRAIGTTIYAWLETGDAV